MEVNDGTIPTVHVIFRYVEKGCDAPQNTLYEISNITVKSAMT